MPARDATEYQLNQIEFVHQDYEAASTSGQKKAGRKARPVQQGGSIQHFCCVENHVWLLIEHFKDGNCDFGQTRHARDA